MPVGQSTETQEVQTVEQKLKLDISMDDFAAQREALIQKLAAQYIVDPSLITLEASAGARRARALQRGSGLTLTITIATSDGSGTWPLSHPHAPPAPPERQLLPPRAPQRRFVACSERAQGVRQRRRMGLSGTRRSHLYTGCMPRWFQVEW